MLTTFRREDFRESNRTVSPMRTIDLELPLMLCGIKQVWVGGLQLQANTMYA